MANTVRKTLVPMGSRRDDYSSWERPVDPALLAEKLVDEVFPLRLSEVKDQESKAKRKKTCLTAQA